MYYTGFADEAAKSLEGQIKATKTLGWSNIESRNIDGTNIHNLSDEQFDQVVKTLEENEVQINCFGSAIANWAKKVDDPNETSMEELDRAIPRMKRLGTKLIRVMSYATFEDRDPEDQMDKLRFEKMNKIVGKLLDAGITPVHENCMNYGGMAWQYTLKLVENVPGLRLVFDTGNPTFNPDRTKAKPWPRQSAWEFYQKTKEYIDYVHIKDTIWDEKTQKPTYTYPGEGEANIPEIVADLLANGYDGGFSMEPHLAVVFHDAAVEAGEDKMSQTYIEYGKRFIKIVEKAKQKA